MVRSDQRGQLVAVGNRLAAAGLVRGSEGNLSVRLNDSECLVTPTGSELGNLDPADLVVVAVDGSKVPDRASSEVHLHLELYRRRGDARAIVHAHPPRLLSLDADGKLPHWRRLEDRGKMLGAVVSVPHHPEGSLTLARSAAEALVHAKACVLSGHGAVTLGPSLMAAFVRMLDLERAASLTGAPG
jgi:ribulose-5-phosphate 4-epimerase/fuculose-1-phosphate aldolase